MTAPSDEIPAEPAIHTFNYYALAFSHGLDSQLELAGSKRLVERERSPARLACVIERETWPDRAAAAAGLPNRVDEA
jgi:hypothetical protein